MLEFIGLAYVVKFCIGLLFVAYLLFDTYVNTNK